jgi:3,4-dihydroxy 2-butanone 4-phosphate synthase/GTP cyclohydrolase II
MTSATPIADPVATAAVAFTTGQPVVLVECGEGGVSLILSAGRATTAAVAFLVRHSAGFLCVAMDAARCDALGLPPMCPEDPAFAVTVDAVGGGTGISAADRAHTMRRLSDPAADPADFTRPGHMAPIRVPIDTAGREHLLALSLDLAAIAGVPRVVGLARLISARWPTKLAAHGEALEFAAEHRLAVLTADELVRRSAERECACTCACHEDFRSTES